MYIFIVESEMCELVILLSAEGVLVNRDHSIAHVIFLLDHEKNYDLYDKNVDESDNIVVHMVAPVGLHFLLPFGDKETFLGSILVFNIHSTN